MSQENKSILELEPPKIWFPSSVDINPTAVCNLHCSFCWGPDHAIPDRYDTGRWNEIVDFLADRGSTGIVFTGGEPLIRKDIGELVKHSKDRGLNVTLSTNTLLWEKRHKEVGPYINELGIPLDGSTREKNNLMRLGNPKQYDTFLRTLSTAKIAYPDVNITVRTVASKVNKDDIVDIGKVLSNYEGLFDRWKIYQFAPVSIGKDHADEHEMNSQEFTDIASEASQQLNTPTRIYSSTERVGRYVFVGPEGNLFGVGDNGDYKVVGNFEENTPDQLVESMQTLVNPIINKLHGQI